MGQKLKILFAQLDAQKRISDEYIDDEYHYDKWLTEQAKISTKLRNFFGLVFFSAKLLVNKVAHKFNLIKNVTDSNQQNSPGRT
jgi:hypothetical protein